MEKLTNSTPNVQDANVEILASIFPEVVTEVRAADGTLRHTIDVDALKERVGDVAEEGRERYQFTWPGKRESKQEAYRVIDKCFRPYPEDSVDWDTTENLYIEGDNLDALKLLRNTYAGKIKMIYIDPPYNTGHDFIYDDNFAQSRDEYDADNGDYDEEGGRLVANPESNGRFHSDWCSMMYPRLLLARDLLSEDGVIFISIDDGESKTLKSICDEIFGVKNFVAQIIWQNKKGGGNDSRHIAVEHEYIFAYAKNDDLLQEFYTKYSDSYLSRYREEDEKGKFYWDTFKRKSGKQYYPITCPDGSVIEYDSDGNKISWLRSKKRFESDLLAGEIRIVNAPSGGWSVQFKQRMPLGKSLEA